MIFLIKEYVKNILLGNILSKQEKIGIIKMSNPKNYNFPTLAIFKSPKEKDMWQVQAFDEEMNPFWDDQVKNLKNALVSSIKKGYKITDIKYF
jgi:hypothetical protein